MPAFKNGTHINKPKRKRGQKQLKYIRFSAGPLRGQYVHRVIVAARIGRELTSEETVDHEDGNSLNDHWSNLSDPISYEEHGRITRERQRKKKEAERKVPF